MTLTIKIISVAVFQNYIIVIIIVAREIRTDHGQDTITTKSDQVIFSGLHICRMLAGAGVWRVGAGRSLETLVWVALN